MAYFNIMGFEPAKTYASFDRAHKAVSNWADKHHFDGRAFNVLVIEVPVRAAHPEFQMQVRYCPLICNIHPDFFPVAIHSGFNIVN